MLRRGYSSTIFRDKHTVVSQRKIYKGEESLEESKLTLFEEIYSQLFFFKARRPAQLTHPDVQNCTCNVICNNIDVNGIFSGIFPVESHGLGLPAKTLKTSIG
jgi:hypothetical protein